MSKTPISKLYRVIDQATGQFRLGGSSWNGIKGHFDARGKLWTNIGHVKSHMSRNVNYAHRAYYHADKYLDPDFSIRNELDGQYLVEYELVEVKRTPLIDILKKK